MGEVDGSVDSPDPGSGLSNTTWFGCLCARRAQRAALLAEKPALLAKSRLTRLPWFPPAGRPAGRLPWNCTFGVSLLLYGSRRKPA